ncbi:uncharacterized protein LOC130999663 [Salvia miltiorrhiza]|uniref:uncharacterized protein LOC130999663 n=1 Tax=Salvia miltiorrhiza TaxID=226208 RepID=UPI0025AD88CA|nr:uncharacterized protein LOC130999663 [Salvia miltiorrhiza]
MEGLIPLVYKSLKKSQTRRKYECLSSGEAAQPYNIADFYVKDDGRDRDEYMGRRGYATPGPDDTRSGRRGAHHRRCSSVVIDGRPGAGGFLALEGGGGAPPPKKQIVRFRSHRMLSCITDMQFPKSRNATQSIWKHLQTRTIIHP